MDNSPPTVRWWEDEPIICFETCLFTLPGISPGNNWQATTDPSIEVDVVAATGALQTHALSFIEAHLTNQVCYFKSEQFREQRTDYLAAYLEKSQAAGYRTIVYFNVHAVKPAFGDEYPQWRQISFDGTQLDGIYGVETSFCVNSGWRDWVRDVCVDLCKYPIDGIFFDGPVVFSDCCYCPTCRELYSKKYGAEMPPKEPRDPNLHKLARFQAESMRDFQAHCNVAIKAMRPDVALYTNAGSREEPYYSVGRNNRVLIESVDILCAEGGFLYYALGDTPVWRVGSNAKYYCTQAGGKPTIVANSPAHGPWRSYYVPEPELRLSLAQAAVHGSGVWLGAFNWFREQPAFEAIAHDYHFYKNHREAYHNTDSKARIAIVWPEDSINFYGKPKVAHGDFTQGGEQGDPVGDINEEFNGFYDALIRNHFPCDVIDEESVRNEDISKYDLVILPNVACTGKDFDERLRDYVRSGGNVIASFETSLCDEFGIRGESPSLSDLFGVKSFQSPIEPYPHFYFYNNDDYGQIFDSIHPTLLPSPLIVCDVLNDGAEAVSAYSVKVRGWEGKEILKSDNCAVTMNSYGNGKAVYLAGTFGSHYWKYKQLDIRLLLRNLIDMLSDRDVATENLPTSVEVAHRVSRDSAREMVHLINYTSNTQRPFESINTISDITVSVRTKANKARGLQLNADLHIVRNGVWLDIEIPILGVFETIVIT